MTGGEVPVCGCVFIFLQVIGLFGVFDCLAVPFAPLVDDLYDSRNEMNA